MAVNRFKQFYESQFPAELKPDFEAFLRNSMTGKRYTERMKFKVATAWISGYTAHMKSSNEHRRRVLAFFGNLGNS